MKKFLIQIGVVVSLAGAVAIPAHAEHRQRDAEPGFSRTIVQYDGGYRRYDWRGFFREIRHARKHTSDHRRQHRREFVRHDRWHWRNDDRWDGYYYGDHAKVHHEQRHAERDFHRNQRRHW